MTRYARSLTRDSADAEDLVHDALVRALEGEKSFRDGGNLKVWLLSIVHNRHVDTLRRRRSEAVRAAHAAEMAETRTVAPQEMSVRLGQLERAFMNLPEEQRAALHLVAVEGLSYAQAADALGVPVNTLTSRVARARAALRQIEETGSRESKPLRIVGGRDGRER